MRTDVFFDVAFVSSVRECSKKGNKTFHYFAYVLIKPLSTICSVQ
jgi:hypothetical protein